MAISKEFINQNEAPGVDACYPVAVLNALVHQDVLTLVQARNVLSYLVRDDNMSFYFTQRELEGGHRIHPFLGYANRLMGAVREACGVEHDNVHTVQLSTLPNPGSTVVEILTSGGVIVGGDSVHAVLVVGRENDDLQISDPRFAQRLFLWSIETFLQKSKEEDWITVVHRRRE